MRIAVLREPKSRGGSIYLHEKLREGDTVRSRGPRNNFGLVPSTKYLFVAGGIGITPILPMIAHAETLGASWRLVYGGRNTASMAFLGELACYGDKVTVWPQDEKGLIDLSGLLDDPLPDTLVYCCGPGLLLDAVQTHSARWLTASVHVERFVAGPLPEPVQSQGFEIELARSGLTLEIPPDRSILELVEAAGVRVLSSCAEGTCGTCETRVLAGVPDHRDSVLTTDEREENSCMMICVSRAKRGRLLLDL